MSAAADQPRIGKEGETNPASDVVKPALELEEIEDAVRALGTPDKLRLRKIAIVYSRAGPLDPDDLLQEAFTRALDGTRRCPREVDVVRFLAEVMRSIASDARKALRRHPELRAEPLMVDGGLAFDPADERLNAEEQSLAEERAESVRKVILELFQDDPVAQVLVEGIMEEMGGEELRLLTDLGKTGFASKRRLIRRRIDAAYPDGWSP
jgi:DNA-directed RNA polymerase specialized sigma24 family protein